MKYIQHMEKNWVYHHYVHGTPKLNLPDVPEAVLNQPCLGLEMPLDLFQDIAPMQSEIGLLTHVRQVNTEDKELMGMDDDGWFAVVVGNRLPEPGKKYEACLVSLEGTQAFLPTEAQTTPLTAKQRIEIDSHPQRGREILEAANVTCQDWLRTVEQHHVTLDGRDVPQDRTDLSQLACMVHYADVYMARISPRSSRVAQPVNIAARELFVKAGGADNPYAAAIIKEMGLYPPGSFVKLTNGDTAVVVRKGDTAATPQVHSLISADGWVFPDSKMRDTAKAEFRVTASVPRGDVMLSLNRAKLFGYTTA